MEDIIARMRDEEADLLRKLSAVRQFLAAYGVVTEATPTRASPSAVPRTKIIARSFVDRIDKFGEYGKRVVDAAADLLPPLGGEPVLTRKLVAKLGEQGVEIRGDNKVNSLSALLARSSQIKGHGRAGWTLATSDNRDGLQPEENEPPSDAEHGMDDGSDAGEEGAPPPTNPIDSNPSPSGSTS